MAGLTYQSTANLDCRKLQCRQNKAEWGIVTGPSDLFKVRLAVSKAVNHFCHVEFTNSQNLHVFSKDCNSHLAEEFFSLCLCKMMSLTGEQGPEKLARCDRYSSLFQQKPLHAIVAADMEYSFQRPQRG